MPTTVILVPPVPSKPVVQLQPSSSPSGRTVAGERYSTPSSSPPAAPLIVPKLVTPKALQMSTKKRAVLTVLVSAPWKIKTKKVFEKPKSHPAQLFLPTSSSPPEAWVIQVASFLDSDNAERLLNQLRAKGFDVYSCQSKGKRMIIRVFIGPVIDRNKIDQIQKSLKQQLQLNGVIRKYVVF